MRISGSYHIGRTIIQKSELEDIIASAITKSGTHNLEKEQTQNDIPKMTRFVVYAAALTFSVLAFVWAGIVAYSFLTVKYSLFLDISKIWFPLRIVIIIISIEYGMWGLAIMKLIARSPNAAFLISFFSAITSIAALLVALFSTML